MYLHHNCNNPSIQIDWCMFRHHIVCTTWNHHLANRKNAGEHAMHCTFPVLSLLYDPATQLPHKIHASITGQSTELVCFRLDEPLALDKVEELGADRTTVQALPLGSFIAWNRLTRSRLAGKVS